jgi:ribose 1,5-bisphosphokinase PhnN
VDQVSASNRDIRDFGSLDATAVGFIHHLEEITRVPVSLISTGPNVSSIIDRRKWRQGTISGLDTDLSTTRSIGFHLNKDAVMSESNSQIGNRYPLTRIVALSGPVGAGKTTVAKALMERDNVVCLRTHDLIRINADRNGVDLPSERRALQQYGDLLDQQTNGAWVADGVIHFIGQCRDAGHLVIVIDSIRRLSQLDGVRAVFQRVDHIHLTAPDFALEQRYRRRGSSSGLIELSGYAEVALNETESGIDSLSDVAKIVIDTNAYGPKQVVCLTSAAINLRGPGGLRLSGGNQKDH